MNLTQTLTTLTLLAALAAPAVQADDYRVDLDIQAQGERALAQIQAELRATLSPARNHEELELTDALHRVTLPARTDNPLPISTIDTSL